LTVEAYPNLEAAFNGDFSGDIDWANVNVVNPERIAKQSPTL
jgi:hypothetical protein